MSSDLPSHNAKPTLSSSAELKRHRREWIVRCFGLVSRRIFQDHRLCSGIVDADYYGKQVNDLWKSAGDPVLHYQIFGWHRGLDPNPLFETSWYLKRYEDVCRKNINPLAHFMRHGWRELRDPSPQFDTGWYLHRNSDVRNAGVNPLEHFIKYGRHEGRTPKPSAAMQALADDTFYIHTNCRAPMQHPVFLDLDAFDLNGSLERLEKSRWRSSGNDPQFLWIGRLPAGFLRIKIEGTCANMRRAAEREAVAEFFFGQGKTRPQDAFTFSYSRDQISINALIFLEDDATSVRFDPVNTEGELDFGTFAIETVDFSCGIRDLYDRYCWQGDKPVHTEREFFEQVQWANVDSFARKMTLAIDHRKDLYIGWMEAQRRSPLERKLLGAEHADAAATPLFSILMPTYKSDLAFLKKAIASVKAQTYDKWELCIVDDGSNDALLHEFLLKQVAQETRINYRRLSQNIGIAAATNEALSMARGDFIALLDHDDELALHALSAMAAAIERTPEADMLYSDEDKIDSDGVRSGPFFKPDWSPEFFLSCMYTCHLGVYRRSLVESVGGFRSAFDFAQDYDLAFRVKAQARAIVHVSDVLYHWRMLPTSTASGADAKPLAELAARRAVQAHIDEEGLSGRVEPGPIPGTHRVKLDLLGSPLISIVIPTAARRLDPSEPRWYLLDLLRSIHERSTYHHFEIVLVENGDIEPALEQELRAFETVRVTYEAPVFNISDKMNLGVAAARGEFVVLLNDDMTIITPDWLEELISWLQRPGIVGVGGKLLFPDNRVQHAGVLLLGQGPSHVYYEAADVDAGLCGSALTVRNYAAVTGACLAVRKADYEKVGGFDPAFRINYNDVDFCLRLGRLGRIVYTGFAKLYHYESVSKQEVIVSELGLLKEKWADILGADPYYNVNFSQSQANTITLRPQRQT